MADAEFQYIDISPEVSEKTAVFPGDTAFSQEIALDFKLGNHLMLSSIQSTVHIGAHTDAPIHYHAQGKAMEQRPLHYYLGPCQVVSVTLGRGERIRPSHLRGTSIRAQRVLFKTGSFPNPDHWNGDFNSLSEELVNWLRGQAVILVGIDTPSIDPEKDETLESHQAVFRHDMAILEGIVLDEAKDGLYTLVALPLRLKGLDASPVRAILLKDELKDSSWKK